MHITMTFLVLPSLKHLPFSDVEFPITHSIFARFILFLITRLCTAVCVPMRAGSWGIWDIISPWIMGYRHPTCVLGKDLRSSARQGSSWPPSCLSSLTLCLKSVPHYGSTLSSRIRSSPSSSQQKNDLPCNVTRPVSANPESLGRAQQNNAFVRTRWMAA